MMLVRRLVDARRERELNVLRLERHQNTRLT
jgi:hypothetical protein